MKKILIVEDDEINRRLLKNLVIKAGAIPVVSPNGRHALELLEVDADIAVLICDYQMPEMTGRQLIETLVVENRTLPTIVVSGVVSVHDIADLLVTGADFFLPKPLNADDVLGYIHSCLQKEPGHTTGMHRAIRIHPKT